MRFLITGGAGFIGSHLAERLVQRDDHVTVLDDLSTGSLQNIEHLKSTGLLDFHLGKIQDRQTVQELVDRADFVLHLAAESHVDRSIDGSLRQEQPPTLLRRRRHCNGANMQEPLELRCLETPG